MTNTPAGARPAWLLGPVPGVHPLLQPAAHALVEAREDAELLLARLPAERLWAKPSGAASVGFHLVHAVGSLDRLLTYARGDALTEQQLADLAAEKSLGSAWGTPSELAARFAGAVDAALAQLRATDPTTLTAVREVGRGKLPSDVIGLLIHAAAHTYRHVGQAITTARIGV